MRIFRKHRSTPRESAVRRVVAAVAALGLLPVTALVASVGTAAPAAAATHQFRGVNWAVFGDNFVTGPLVLDGLSSSDSYATVYAKADVVYDQMESLLGVNTVRLPVNTHTVGTDWWTRYRATIDAAADRGFKVILAYWEDGAASGGQVTNYAAWNTMWSEVTNRYGGNSRVYFEPMNEPHGYTSAAWRDVAATWLATHYSAPRERVLIGGTGYSQDLRDVCNDSRFSGTLLSFHHYAFFYGTNTYDGWKSHVTQRLGNCASRAVVTEFGGAMHTGLNYGDPNSTDNFVRHIRAVTDVMRENTMGGTYWPALGGKPTGTLGYDGYSILHKTGSGTNLTLSIRNASGANRLRWAWGDAVDPNAGNPGSTATDIVNVNSGKCIDVVNGSTSPGAEIIQYTCHGGTNQRWTLQDAGGGYHRLVSQASGLCLDVNGASSADGAQLIQWTCNGATNQQWTLRATSNGTELVARHSGKCADVVSASTANGARVKQYPCNGGTNQRWNL